MAAEIDLATYLGTGGGFGGGALTLYLLQRVLGKPENNNGSKLHQEAMANFQSDVRHDHQSQLETGRSMLMEQRKTNEILMEMKGALTRGA